MNDAKEWSGGLCLATVVTRLISGTSNYEAVYCQKSLTGEQERKVRNHLAQGGGAFTISKVYCYNAFLVLNLDDNSEHVNVKIGDNNDNAAYLSDHGWDIVGQEDRSLSDETKVKTWRNILAAIIDDTHDTKLCRKIVREHFGLNLEKMSPISQFMPNTKTRREGYLKAIKERRALDKKEREAVIESK